MKNSNNTNGNRTRNLPTCSAMPQPTEPPRTPKYNFMRQPLCIFTFYTSEYKLRTFKDPDHYTNCSQVSHPHVGTFDSVAQNKIPHVVILTIR